MNMLRLEDVARLADGAEELTRETAEHVRAWVRSDRRFTPIVQRLESLASAASLPHDLRERLGTAVEICGDLERLVEAGETWDHPAEVLDPGGELGLGRTTLEALSSLAASMLAAGGSPEGLESVRARIERALEGKRADEDLVARFVGELEKRDELQAEGLLRDAQRLLQARGADAGRSRNEQETFRE